MELLQHQLQRCLRELIEGLPPRQLGCGFSSPSFDPIERGTYLDVQRLFLRIVHLTNPISGLNHGVFNSGECVGGPDKAEESTFCSRCATKKEIGDEWYCCSDCSEPAVTDVKSKTGYCQTEAHLRVQPKPRGSISNRTHYRCFGYGCSYTCFCSGYESSCLMSFCFSSCQSCSNGMLEPGRAAVVAARKLHKRGRFSVFDIWRMPPI